MESDLRSSKQKGANNLEPLNVSMNRPIRWSRRSSSFQNWRDFKPFFLCSDGARYAMVEPCNADWWERRRSADIAILGYHVKTSDKGFVIQGSTTRLSHDGGKQFFLNDRAIVVIDDETNAVLAGIDNGIRRLEFSDGVRYEIFRLSWRPLKWPAHFEFADEKGTRQFLLDREGSIGINPLGSPVHMLLLIIVERYLDDLYMAEAGGG